MVLDFPSLYLPAIVSVLGVPASRSFLPISWGILGSVHGNLAALRNLRAVSYFHPFALLRCCIFVSCDPNVESSVPSGGGQGGGGGHGGGGEGGGGGCPPCGLQS